LERLSKYISHCGIASRRNSENLILSGRIKVNNNIIIEPYYNVDCNNDVITLDNKLLTKITKHVYVVLNKPVGYISDLKDVKSRKIARDLIGIGGKLFPIGRLDYNSEGLIIFTNDGELANKIMHPRYGVEKEYLVKFKGVLSDKDFYVLKNGLLIDGTISSVNNISYVKSSLTNNWYKIILDEGRNRIIRKFGDIIGHPVLKLKRVRIGHIKLGDLAPGKYRILKEKKIMSFKILPD
jgi:23S rRNA pseudouridine2605 synthase